MEIRGLGGLSHEQIGAAIQQGAKFVMFEYCWSALVVTARRSSPIHYVPPGASRYALGAKYLLCTLFLGWWGIPWGPIYSIAALANYFRGGNDVTAAVMYALQVEGEVPGEGR
ncbi:MAG: hypothetical protein JSR82_11640 [Verrucomicrobia bacterium]|nr:hypothetical protein [Verrucomicrobiota bacterium]